MPFALRDANGTLLLAAGALVEYATKNHVDEIIIGARSSSMLRRYLGSVSSQVVAESSCTVTVVRAPHAPSESSAAE